jgi:aminopeptidase N
MRSVLRHPALDPAFKELVLTLPARPTSPNSWPWSTRSASTRARSHARAQLATPARRLGLGLGSAPGQRGYRPTPAQAGRRALANLALAMLCLHAVRSGDPVWPGRAYQRFKDAGNMTDRSARCRRCGQRPRRTGRAGAGKRFHELFRRRRAGAGQVVRAAGRRARPVGGCRAGAGARQGAAQAPRLLAEEPEPRAQPDLHAVHANPAAFHRADAAGYVFWADRVLELDAFNPQVAARLARAMDRWAVLAEPYRSAAREAIARVAAKPDLSNDVREIVTRAWSNP